MRPFERIEAGAGAAAVAAIAVAYVFACRWLAWPVVDDAGITLVYGRTFFEGFGFRATPASQVVEGFSSPLWALILGLQRFTAVDPDPFMWWAGVLAQALSLPCFALWGPMAEGRGPRLEDALAPALIAVNPSLAAWASSGMETGLWSLALGVAGAVVLRGVRLGRGVGAGAALGALLLVRPEAPLFALAVVPVWLVAALTAGRRPWREAAQACAGGVAVAGAFLLFRWAYFADLLPNTWWAKRLWGFEGDGYVGAFIGAYDKALWSAGAGLAAAMAWRKGPSAAALLAVLWAAAALGFARSGDWMGEWRFVVPAVPLLAAAAGAGLSAARGRLFGEGVSIAARAAAVVGLVALLGASALAGTQARARWAAVKAAPQFPFSFTRNQFEALKPQLAALGQRRALLGFPDMGGQAWALRDAELMDVAGLCDRAVARHANNYPAIEDYLVSEGPPLLVDAHGPSGHLIHFKKMLAMMQPAGGPMWIVAGVSAQEDPRCPGGKAAVLALAPDALVAALDADLERGEPVTAIRRWRCAWAYHADDKLPPRGALAAVAARAWERSKALEAQGQLEPALRHASMATVLSGQNAHYRRRTELLRERLFPRPASG